MNAIRRRYLYYFGVALVVTLAGLAWGFWLPIAAGTGIVVWGLLGLALHPFHRGKARWSVQDLEAGLRSGTPLLIYLSSRY